MITKINIPKKYENRFLKKECFEFSPTHRLNLLWGSNGVGKSSLLSLIANQNKYDCWNEKISENNEKWYTETVVHSFKNEIPKVYYFKSSIDALLRNNGYALDDVTNFGLLWDSKHISEGQSLTQTFIAKLKEIPEDIDVLLIDELDSGVSAGLLHICYIVDWLKEHKNVQCFIAINNYHWVYTQKKVYRMDIGEYQNIDSYDEFWDISRDISIKVADKLKERDDY